MAFEFTITKQGVIGDLAYSMGTWVATGVTSGDIVTALAEVRSPGITFSTAQRGTIDHTATAGTIALTGVTSGDAGTFFAVGRR